MLRPPETLELDQAGGVRKYPEVVAVHVDLMPKLTAHAVLDALRLAHRDPCRDERPRRRLVSVRPVHWPESGKHALKTGDNRIALAYRRPLAAVHVDAQDARYLVLDAIDVRAAVHRPDDSIG
jgi:hypothetical protein